MSNLTEFDYLLNRFERASQAATPAEHGYGEHRRALYAYVRDLEAKVAATPIVDMVPPATQRDRWMYAQGRLAERDPRTHVPAAGVVQVCAECDIADCRHIRAARTV